MIHNFTAISLKLELAFDELAMGSATGYIVKRNDQYFLISNLHVFSGRNFETGEIIHTKLATPNKVTVHHHSKDFGNFVECSYPLLRNGTEIFGAASISKADVAALPIDVDLTRIYIHDFDYAMLASAKYPVWPSQDVSIIGFPFGLSSGRGFPIWKTGHVASEIDIKYQGMDCFLVDAATRGGMSGSPVFATTRNTYVDPADGLSKIMVHGPGFKFLGTYSGRLLIPENISKILGTEEKIELVRLGSDLGMVWHWQTINTAIDNVP